MKTALVFAAIGGSFAVVEGLLLIALGGLAGLADNPEAERATASGYVVLAIGAIVLMSAFVARRRPILLAITTAASAAAGFLVENALWFLAAALLLGAAAFALISMRAGQKPS